MSKPLSTSGSTSGQADSGWDDHPERVLRNEGRLEGLENLVRETREADRKLIEQRSDSLAQELERRADSLITLSQTERESDNREHREALAAHAKHADDLREADHREFVALMDAHEKQATQRWSAATELIAVQASVYHEKHTSGEERHRADVRALEAMVVAWRQSDTEARLLAYAELGRRLDILNGAHQKQLDFQAQSVTRELFGADKEASAQREATTREMIVSLEKALLGMTPLSTSERAHTEIVERMETAATAAALTTEARINGLAEKVAEMRSYVDSQTGAKLNTSAMIGWLVAIISIFGTLVVAANILTGK